MTKVKAGNKVEFSTDGMEVGRKFVGDLQSNTNEWATQVMEHLRTGLDGGSYIHGTTNNNVYSVLKQGFAPDFNARFGLETKNES